MTLNNGAAPQQPGLSNEPLAGVDGAGAWRLIGAKLKC
jgi:hypothetical protein